MKNLPRSALLLDSNFALDVEPVRGFVELELYGRTGGVWLPCGGPWMLSPALARRIGRRLFAVAEAAAEWLRASRILKRDPTK